jgi:DHA1 family tetracycline resistance protein-like MFS transporter
VGGICVRGVGARRLSAVHTSGPAAPRPPGFWVVWTTVAIDLIGFGIVIPILPVYAERFGASAATATLIVATFSAAQFVFAPIWGRLSDRIGRKPVLVLALCGTAVGSLVTGLAGSLWVLFLGRAIDGASGTSYAVAQAAVTDIAEPAARPRLLGLLGAAFGLGFVAGPLLGSVAALGSDRLPFYLAAALAATNAVLALIRLPETRAVAAAGVATSRRAFSLVPHALRHDPTGVVRRFALIALVGMTAFSGFEATFALLADRRLGLEDSSIYGMFAVIGILLVLVQVRVVGPVSDRAGEQGALRLALGANLVGFALLAVEGGWWTTVPAVVVLVVGQGVLAPSLASSAAGAAPPEARGEVLGVNQAAGALGRIIGPVSAGLLFEHVAHGAPYLVAAVLAGLAMFVASSLPSPGRPSVPSGSDR